MMRVVGTVVNNLFKFKKEKYIVELRFFGPTQTWKLFSTVGNSFKTEQEALDFCKRFNFKVIRPIETPIETKAEVNK